MTRKVKVETADDKLQKKREETAAKIQQIEGEFEENDAKPFENEEEVVTLKDLCQVGRSDIKNKSRKELIYNAVCHCAGMVMNQPEYRAILNKTKEKLTNKILDIFKIANYRKELVIVLSLYLSRSASLPNYVVVLGSDHELSVKYSRGSLIQILIAKTFNMTLFEVPRIAISTLQ